MPYLKKLKQKAKLAPSHTYPDLASLIPAIDTFVSATSNLNKNPDSCHVVVC